MGEVQGEEGKIVDSSKERPAPPMVRGISFLVCSAMISRRSAGPHPRSDGPGCIAARRDLSASAFLAFPNPDGEPQGLIDLCRLDNTRSKCNGRRLGPGRLHLGKSGQQLLDLALLVWLVLQVRARHARYSS